MARQLKLQTKKEDGNRFFISIDQDWEDKPYTDSFLEVLRGRGISYEIIYDGPNDIPVMLI